MIFEPRVRDGLGYPQTVEHWSLTTLREKLTKIRAEVMRHGRYSIFRMAAIVIPRNLFVEILRLIDGLRPSAPGLFRSCSGVGLPLLWAIAFCICSEGGRC